jgi:peptidoglycan hydrolase CwlO-like protein
MNLTLITAFEKATSSASFQDTIGRASAIRVVANNSNL